MEKIMAENNFMTEEKSAYTVRLEIFEGPLDLLLHLIQKNELDIFNIPIALITEQYLEYLQLMKVLNLDVAGDYLLMASTLLHIKSKMLLPKSSEGEEEEGEDPRAELIRKLLERVKTESVHEVILEHLSVEDKIEEILALLERENRSLSFHRLFPEEVSRRVVVITLLAILELVKMKRIRIFQMAPFETIRVPPM